MPKVQVTFLPSGKQVQVPVGTNIREAAAAAGIPLEGTCGGRGTCGKCRVKVRIEGESSTVLACQHLIEADGVIWGHIPAGAHERKSLLRGDPGVPLEPAVTKEFLELAPPSVKDQAPDLERIIEKMPAQRGSMVSCSLLRDLPHVLRQAGFKVTSVTAGDELIAVEPGDTTGEKYGIAFDLGTTTVAGSLMDLNSGREMAVASATNPQSIYGADVISRINYTLEQQDGLARMQELALSALNGIISRLLEETGVVRERVYEAVVVGNTTMSHLLLGVDPAYLAPAPFVPVFRQAGEVLAGEIGLDIHPRGRIHMLPNVAGYVGSDTMGMMLATRIDRRPGFTLAVDIGTNGEIVLAGRGRILACSAAAGPAFEGAHIRCGMRAAEGAIEGAQVSGDVHLKVIGHMPPVGVCGSGLLDAVAGMVGAGVLDASGRMASHEEAVGRLDRGLLKRLRTVEGKNEFVLAFEETTGSGEAVVITQQDVRELQLAKGAIHAGIQVLLAEMGVTAMEIDRVLLAGAFGNYLKKESALATGLLPAVNPEKIESVGNAAGTGAGMALVSKAERVRVSEMVQLTEHIELSARRDFQEKFIDALGFPAVPKQ